MTKTDIAYLLVRRDDISLEEAREAVENCQEEINDILDYGGTLDAAEESIAYWLGLEPDYLMAFLD